MVEVNRTIIMEHEGNLLVRINGVVTLGEKKYKTLSYEIWTDREKFNQNIDIEWKDGNQYIYCSNYATTDEDDMLKTFKRRFNIRTP